MLFSRCSLRIPEACPLRRRIPPCPRNLTDNDWQFCNAKVPADILNQVHKIGLVFWNGCPRVNAIIPAVIPDKARKLEWPLHTFESLLDVSDHQAVVLPGHPTRARRTEVAIKALPTPRALDQQNVISDHIANDMPKLQLRSEVMDIQIRSEPKAKWPYLHWSTFRLIPNANILSDTPAAIWILEMSHLTGKPRLFDQGCERPASIVVVGSLEIDDSLALHIGLPGEDENLCHSKASVVAIIDV
jgi:hypothetical protein